MKLRSLILVGGLSSRMKSPKHELLVESEGYQQSLLQKLLRHHEQFQSEVLGYETSQVTISVRNLAQKSEVENLCAAGGVLLSDLDIVVDKLQDCGPLAGLVAAFNADPSAHWLVTGCDYPLLETETLHQLWSAHTSDTWTTCFRNDFGFFEPLLAIWSPKALRELQSMARLHMEAGRKFGPSSAIRAFERNQGDEDVNPKVNSIQPEKSQWIKNVNTPAEWQEVLLMING